MTYFVYSIYNVDNDKIYIGQTNDLENRLLMHNNKIFKGYTSRFSGKWKLFYKETTPDRLSALKREKQLKSYRGRMFLKGIIYSRVAQR